MSDYYTSIELGTDSIKILVCNKNNGKFHVIAAVSSPSEGIKKGIITDSKSVISSVKKALKKVNDMLGIKITKAILALPTNDCKMDIVVGSTLLDDTSQIDGSDISNVIKDSIKGHVKEDEEVVTAIPISFQVDDKENIKDPHGMSGEELGAKVLLTVSKRELVYSFLEVLKLSGLDIIDIAYKSTGDYYEISNKDIDKSVSAIINIGEDSTNISVFNKGIMIKNKIINVGSKNIDNDISYIYKIDRNLSRDLKENFVIASPNYADVNEVCEVKNTNLEEIELNQLEVSKIVEARCNEILKVAKNELKNLTKKEIRYIIITGGVSELAGFQYALEDVFDLKARICNINTMGVRHNKYSTTLGIIKYFDDKLTLRDKSVSMIASDDITSLITVKENNKENNENIINRFFGRFFEN